MKSTFNVLFFVKKDKLKINGSNPIFVRIVCVNKRKTYSVFA